MDLTDPRVLEFTKEHPNESHENTLIHLLSSSEHYRALEAKIDRKIAELRESVENRPKINTQEIPLDIRYLLGMVKALTWVKDQPYNPD